MQLFDFLLIFADIIFEFDNLCEICYGAGLVSHLFDIIDKKADENNKDFWRIFNMDYQKGILNKIPQDTTLRRRFKEYFDKGNTMGSGYGILLFDGEKILKGE